MLRSYGFATELEALAGCPHDSYARLMRPTIPLGPWRLAVDLKPSRALNALDTLPARGCECAACRLWADTGVAQLPAGLTSELRRLGVEPDRPSEVYVHSEDDEAVGVRVTYHCVGRVLSGPSIVRDSPAGRAGRNYEPLAEAPARVSIAVSPQAALGGPPGWAPPAMQPLIAVDIFVRVPRRGAG